MRSYGPEQNTDYMRNKEDNDNVACYFLFLSSLELTKCSR